MLEFICNICGQPQQAASERLNREEPSCSTCGSNVRVRGMIRVLSMELFGINLALNDFPRMKSLRGLGTTDTAYYSDLLGEKFDYRNTFYSREPRLDIANPPAHEFGQYDFVISSEVLEHVLPPAHRAFESACRLLKPNGIFLLTVPYSMAGHTDEHFPELHEFGLARVGDRMVLVNRTAAGKIEVFENLVFHLDADNPELEMREFSESGLKESLLRAGFSDVRVYCDGYPPFGVLYDGAWSLPIAARKGRFSFNADATRDVLDQWSAVLKDHQRLSGRDKQLTETKWELAVMKSEVDRINAEFDRIHTELDNRIEELVRCRSVLRETERRLRAPLTGSIVQAETFQGLYADDWLAPHAETWIQPLLPVSGLTIFGFRPNDAPDARIRLAINGAPAAEQAVRGGDFSVAVRSAQLLDNTFRLTIDLESSTHRFGDDHRDLGFVLNEIRARHPLRQTLGLWRRR